MELFRKKKAEQAAEDRKKYNWKQNLVMDLKELFYVLAVFMIVYMLFFRVVVVVGPSMYNTLVNGDRLLLVSSTFYTEPKQGDIIVASKKSFENGECIVKRVIATEGQTVDIDFQQGIVYVDGKALQEDYAYTPTTLFEGVSFPLTVDEGHVFVLGDNRQSSKDSRNPQIGLIDNREILGKAIFLMSPAEDEAGSFFERFGVID